MTPPILPFRAFWPASMVVGVALVFIISATPLVAYESYHDPNLNDQGYCSSCHSGFTGGRSDSLHSLHTGGSDPMLSNCNLCHTGSGRDNPLIMWSTGDNDDGLGCMGCHGRDYGETVGSDYRGFSITGKAKNSGRGLRRHHALSGISVCGNCHADAEPYPENVINPGLGNTLHYYLRNDVSLGGNGVDTIINEDTANDADAFGLDNDGDGLYDRNDPDYISTDLLLTITRTITNTIVVTWPAPAENWTLQENGVLGTPDWMNLPTPTLRMNGSWRMIVNPQPTPNFYRLTAP